MAFAAENLFRIRNKDKRRNTKSQLCANLLYAGRQV
jgi:hypothetical protein